MFLRAFRICSPEYFDMEISNIFDIGFRLKYPKKVLDVSLRKARKTFYSAENKKNPILKDLLVLAGVP